MVLILILYTFPFPKQSFLKYHHVDDFGLNYSILNENYKNNITGSKH